MSARIVYEYALLRATPRMDRGECVNVGVILYCQGADFLDVAVHVDPDRLRALAADADAESVLAAAEAFAQAAHAIPPGNPREGGGMGAHFRWLTAPRSTVVHAGPVHAGVTSDPAAQLQGLLDRLVR
jgi:hypothetical protein